VDEVLMKDFMAFALKKRFIVDEKELVSLFKDLCGNQALADRPYLKRSEFECIFYRPCFKGAHSNIFDYVERSSIIMKAQPFAVKVLSYQRDLLYAGIQSANKRGLDVKIVRENLKVQETEFNQQFARVKEELLATYRRLKQMTATSEANTEIFHPSLKRAFMGSETPDEQLLMEVIDSDRTV
jgi:hypothetical protein